MKKEGVQTQPEVIAADCQRSTGIDKDPNEIINISLKLTRVNKIFPLRSEVTFLKITLSFRLKAECK